MNKKNKMNEIFLSMLKSRPRITCIELSDAIRVKRWCYVDDLSLQTGIFIV